MPLWHLTTRQLSLHSAKHIFACFCRFSHFFLCFPSCFHSSFSVFFTYPAFLLLFYFLVVYPFSVFTSLFILFYAHVFYFLCFHCSSIWPRFCCLSSLSSFLLLPFIFLSVGSADFGFPETPDLKTMLLFLVRRQTFKPSCHLVETCE